GAGVVGGAGGPGLNLDADAAFQALDVDGGADGAVGREQRDAAGDGGGGSFVSGGDLDRGRDGDGVLGVAHDQRLLSQEAGGDVDAGAIRAPQLDPGQLDAGDGAGELADDDAVAVAQAAAGHDGQADGDVLDLFAQRDGEGPEGEAEAAERQDRRGRDQTGHDRPGHGQREPEVPKGAVASESVLGVDAEPPRGQHEHLQRARRRPTEQHGD